MQIKLTNSRNFLYRTCWKMDNGIPVNNDAAMLKRYAAPALTEVCSDALQLFGGFGSLTSTAQGGTAFFAHVGGFIAGIILIFVMGTRPRYWRRNDLNWG